MDYFRFIQDKINAVFKRLNFSDQNLNIPCIEVSGALLEIRNFISLG